MRLTLRLSMLFCAVLLVPSAWAHGPTPQRLTLEANFAAAPEDVWLVLGGPLLSGKLAPAGRAVAA